MRMGGVAYDDPNPRNRHPPPTEQDKGTPVEVGMEVELDHTFGPECVQTFAALSGDDNPIHLDHAYATKQVRVEGRRRVAAVVCVHLLLPTPSVLIDWQINQPISHSTNRNRPTRASSRAPSCTGCWWAPSLAPSSA